MDDESTCPVTNGNHRRPDGARSNRDWWPNRLDLKPLQQNPPDGQSDGRGLRLRRGVQHPRPRRPEGGRRDGDDDVAGLVAGRLRPLRSAPDPDGVAQRGHLPHQRRPRGRRVRRAALRAPQQLARQRQPRQGAQAALAGQEEVRPEDLVGRPHGLRRQLCPGVDGLRDPRLRRRARGRLGARGDRLGHRGHVARRRALQRRPGAGESACRRPDGPHLREPGRTRTATRIRLPPPGTSGRRSVAWP